ncbi:MAG: glycosyltransferase family protein [Vicinamibacterales bacterium]
MILDDLRPWRKHRSAPDSRTWEGASLLYAGQLEPGGGSAQRRGALGRLGFDCRDVDFLPFMLWGPKLVRAAMRLTASGPSIARLNETIRRAIGEQTPDILWVDRGIWIHPDTLAFARRAGVSLLVHFSPDPMFVVHDTRHLRASVPLYDVCITPKEYELEAYARHGARRTMLVPTAYDASLHHPVPEHERRELEPFESDVCFIGHHEPWYEEVLRGLTSLRVRVAIWGPRWSWRCRDRVVRTWIRGDYAAGRDYARAVWGSKVALGFISAMCPDPMTARNIELAAMRTCQIAPRRTEVAEVFRDGDSILLCDRPVDFRDAVERCLESLALRTHLAATAERRVRDLGLDVDTVMRRVVALLPSPVGLRDACAAGGR